jgi:hypothetical protein
MSKITLEEMTLQGLYQRGYITAHARNKVARKGQRLREGFLEISTKILLKTKYEIRDETLERGASVIISWTNRFGWSSILATALVIQQGEERPLYKRRTLNLKDTVRLMSNEVLLPFSLKQVNALLDCYPAPPFFIWPEEYCIYCEEAITQLDYDLNNVKVPINDLTQKFSAHVSCENSELR